MQVKDITIGLLKVLSKRSRDIVMRRYGLIGRSKPETLEAIGKRYGITRERIRQVEIAAKKTMRKGDIYSNEATEFAKEFKKKLDSVGGVLKIDDFFDHFEISKKEREHVYFIIDITEEMHLEPVSKEYHKLVHTSHDKKKLIKDTLESLYKRIKDNQILNEDEIVSHFLDEIEKEIKLKKEKQVLPKKILKSKNIRRMLNISKKISSNYLGGWGRTESRNISGKGIKDMAYLTFRKLNKPLHFRDVVVEIYKNFDKKVNPATCHNELIRDKRFILIGRGVYALREWGEYEEGTVAEIIERVIKGSRKKLSAEEIAKMVMERKDVKEQTIVVNLHRKDKFTKNKDGKYSLVVDSEKKVNIKNDKKTKNKNTKK